ncbi:MAG: hypothetical protein KA144_12395 [Xanthomonadaceae bacterium]|nr:hypothetical protein [Xanthomonadaceae bacterium]
MSHSSQSPQLPTGFLPDEEEDEISAVRLADVSEDDLVDFDAEDENEAEPVDAMAGAAADSGASGGTSGGTAIGIDELAIEKWTEEQKQVYESVKKKAQELGLSQDNVERIAAYSVVQFMSEKNERPDTRVDRVQAVNANGDVVVRMEHMKYGDREPIFNNDVRLKDAPAFEQSAAQIEQANERVHNKQATEQDIAQHHQNQDTNQKERPSVLEKVDDQVMARVQSSIPALSRSI